MRRNRLTNVLLPAMIVGLVSRLSAQQSDATISPSLSMPAKGSAGTLGGLSLTLAASPGVALRASGYVALKKTTVGGVGTSTWLRPWTADVDAVFALAGRPLGSRNRTAASYGVFGLGKSALDTTNVRAVNKNWSYGIGTSVPLGAPVDLFAEWRWRMSKLVLPTARPKPTRSKELRFGMSLHLARRN